MKLTNSELQQVVEAIEGGGSATVVVCRLLPMATSAEVDAELNQAYDAAQFPEHDFEQTTPSPSKEGN